MIGERRHNTDCAQTSVSNLSVPVVEHGLRSSFDLVSVTTPPPPSRGDARSQSGIGTRTLSLAGATVPTPDPELAKQYARFVCSMHDMTGARR